MTRSIAELAPDLLRDDKVAEARQYQRADYDKAEVARSKGLGHSEGPDTIYFLKNILIYITRK